MLSAALAHVDAAVRRRDGAMAASHAADSAARQLERLRDRLRVRPPERDADRPRGFDGRRLPCAAASRLAWSAAIRSDGAVGSSGAATCVSLPLRFCWMMR